MTKQVIPFPQTVDAQLRFAIANKRLMRFTYEGATRIAEPHDYGVRGGTAQVLAFQREKAGSKGQDVRGWRWLDPAKIEDCAVLEESFAGSRQAPDQQHHQWDVLYARVDQEP